MFSSPFVCLSVKRIALNYLTGFHKILWNGGTRAEEKRFDFSVNPNSVTLRLGLE